MPPMPQPDTFHAVFVSMLTAVLMPNLAMAQTQAPVPPSSAAPLCAAVDKVIPAPWQGWATPEPLSGGASLGGAGKLAVGHSYRAVLPASSAMTYFVPLYKPAAAGTFAGLFTLTIGTAGTYSIALGEGAWIDVAPETGKALSSVSHGHGPDCTTIHKVVDFALQPGVYVVQISAAPASPVVIAVAPKS
jgi:hypothetical protein